MSDKKPSCPGIKDAAFSGNQPLSRIVRREILLGQIIGPAAVWIVGDDKERNAARPAGQR